MILLLSEREMKVLRETNQRNVTRQKLKGLKTRYAKMVQHADLTKEAEELKQEINELENQLAMT